MGTSSMVQLKARKVRRTEAKVNGIPFLPIPGYVGQGRFICKRTPVFRQKGPKLDRILVGWDIRYDNVNAPYLMESCA